MILTSAQTKPKRGNTAENLLDHYRLIELAAVNNTDLILFPEMSITGYEREDAEKFAFSIDDSRLNHLKKLAVGHKMIIIAGAPIKIGSDLYIGAFILFPDNTVSIYTKQFLHTGEEVYFKSSFDFNPLIELEDERISLAICADIDNPLHPENASKVKTTIYMPGIFFSPNGIPEAHDLLSRYAQKYSMNVLMSNFCDESWGRPSGGRSAFWSKNGKKVAEMDDLHSGLLIVEKIKDTWTGRTIKD
jgi:predicted amidohydrolase